jgi:peroxiredoxin
MRNRLSVLLTTVSLAGLCGCPLFLQGGDNPASSGPGKKVAGFSLEDTTGRTVSLADFKDKKAVAVIFLGTECPVNNAFLPRLRELHEEFSPRGVQFLGINANRQDTAERVAEHARRHALPFPVLKDDGSRTADLFNAQRTPEAFVLDAERTVRYQGRIDDQFGVFYQRPQPTRRDLALALEEVLAGKAVTQATTPVAGCLISREKKAKADGTITYTQHVARILQKNCQECHRPGQIGPMALLSYADAAAWADTIREVVHEGRMPPWFADPHFGKFYNDRRLSPEERETLLAWVDQGCPEGDAKDLPPAREFTQGWTIGTPDVVFTMPEAFEVPATAPKTGIPYKYFTIETNFTEDKWIERAEARPDALPVVHHIVVFISPPNQPANLGQTGMRVLVGNAPGDMPLILKPGLAKKVPAGSKLVLQMHYTPNGTAQKDRSSVGLIFAKEPPKHQVMTMPVANRAIRIPPGDGNYKVESWYTFQQDSRIVSFMPHMHLRGKDFLYEVIHPDGKKETLLSVPRYNFNWQSVYRCADPPAVPKGTRLHCIAHFDNSDQNPNNPDPTQTVRWGDQTWEEMMIGWTDFFYDGPAAK